MRKQIRKENCIEVGYVKKSHGVKGDLSVVFNDDIIHKEAVLDFLFFEIDGLLVPYAIESERENLSNFKFKYIDTKENAQEFVGCKVFQEKEKIEIDRENLSTSILVGFTLSDTQKGEIGEVVAVDDFGGNVVLTVSVDGEDVMIPYSEDLITLFSLDDSSIEMNCPDGIFDLSE